MSQGFKKGTKSWTNSPASVFVVYPTIPNSN